MSAPPAFAVLAACPALRRSGASCSRTLTYVSDPLPAVLGSIACGSLQESARCAAPAGVKRVSPISGARHLREKSWQEGGSHAVSSSSLRRLRAYRFSAVSARKQVRLHQLRLSWRGCASPGSLRRLRQLGGRPLPREPPVASRLSRSPQDTRSLESIFPVVLGVNFSWRADHYRVENLSACDAQPGAKPARACLLCAPTVARAFSSLLFPMTAGATRRMLEFCLLMGVATTTRCASRSC